MSSLTIATVDCQPQGCQSQVTFNFSSFNSVSREWRHPYICFTYDQTYNACRPTWVETNGGCPYNYCNMHKAIQDTKETLWQQLTSSVRLTMNLKSTFFLTIPDPWDSRWAAGVEARLYRAGYDSYPVARLRIFRAYVRVVSSLVSLASDIKQQEKAISAIVDPGSKPQDSSNPFSANLSQRRGSSGTHGRGMQHLSPFPVCGLR